MMMARRGLTLNIPPIGSQMDDTQHQQQQQAPPQPQSQQQPAVHTTMAPTATHPQPASKLAMRRGHKAAPLSLSIACAEVPNDEDTSEEHLTPEGLDALFEAAALSNMSSPTTSDVSDISDVSDARDLSIDEEEEELERAFLRSPSPLAHHTTQASSTSSSSGSSGIYMPHAPPRSARRAKGPISRFKEHQQDKKQRPRSSSDTRVLERLLSTSSPSLRTTPERKPQVQRHSHHHHHHHQTPPSVVTIACRQTIHH